MITIISQNLENVSVRFRKAVTTGEYCYNSGMPRTGRKPILLICAVLFLGAFLVFTIPNSRASENPEMVAMFEPDEGVCLPVVSGMITPKGDFVTFLRKFIFYDFYSYGFPYFGTSALFLFPVQWAGQMQNTALVMLALRQLVSVLPMLVALLLLVYLHDGFRTYRSAVLFVLLLLIPAVIQNGLWWHPDGLALLLAVLVLLFLWKDQRQFGWRFFTAAALCGVLTATKMVGVYFFLAVGLALIWGFAEKKKPLKRLLLSAAGFVVIMAAAFILANPFLLSGWAREGYFFTMNLETQELSKGYGLIYGKGLKAALPTMRQFYGEAVFLLLVLGVSLWGVWKSEKRYLFALTLAWFIPLTISLLTVTHFKYQYWLPVAMPLIANLYYLLPEKPGKEEGSKMRVVSRVTLLLIVVIQLALFTRQDVETLVKQSRRQVDNPRIEFFDKATAIVKPLEQAEMKVFYDYRLYVPKQSNWLYNTSYGILNYAYIEAQNFDILFLLESRMLDYLNPNAEGVDPAELEEGRRFYSDALAGTISGYRQLFKDETAVLFIRNETCRNFFEDKNCD